MNVEEITELWVVVVVVEGGRLWMAVKRWSSILK